MKRRDYSSLPNGVTPVGNLIPDETALNELTALVRNAMSRRNVSVDDLIAATLAARAEIVQREFGETENKPSDNTQQ